MLASPLPHYRASGKTSWRLLPSFTIAAAAATGLGWAYQALTTDHYVALNLVEYVVFLVGVAAAVVAAIRLGRNRNRGLGALAGLAIAAAALGAAYYFDWKDHAPLSFGDFLDYRVHHGWTLGKRAVGQAGTVTGTWVWLVWTIEALLVFVIAAAFGTAFGPFCERSGEWMEVETLLRRDNLDAAAVDVVRKAITIDDVFRLPPPTGAGSAAPATAAAPRPYTLVYKAHRCRRCTLADVYVTVTAHHIMLVRRQPWGHIEKPTSETLQVQVTVPAARVAAFTAPAR